jgi:hypothetical protein
VCVCVCMYCFHNGMPAVKKYWVVTLRQVMAASLPSHHPHSARGAPKRGLWRAAAPSNPPKPKFKRHFLAMMISNVLCNLPFSRNQPLKSADD